MRTLFVGLAGALLAGASAQDWDAKINFETRARPVGEVVVELSKASGIPMATSALVEDDIVFVRLRDITTRTACAKISEATGSTRRDLAGVRTLTRSSDEEKRQWEKDATIRAADFEPAFAAHEKALAAKKYPEGDVNYDPTLFRSLIAILKTISPDIYGGIEPDERMVFTLTPTRMQRSLPVAAIPIIRNMMEDEQALIRQRIAYIKRERAYDTRWLAICEEELRKLEYAGPLNPMLIVSHENLADFTITLRAYSADNDLLGFWSEAVPLEDRKATPSALTESFSNDILPFSDRAVNWASLWRDRVPSRRFVEAEHDVIYSYHISPDRGLENVDPELRKVAARPDLHEPLDYFASELLTRAAGERSIVACLPDSAMRPCADAVLMRWSPDQAWSGMKALGLFFRLDEGIYVVTPRLPSLSRYERANRKAMAAFAVECGGLDHIPLMSFARYALATRIGAYARPFDVRVFAIGAPQIARNLVWSYSEDRDPFAMIGRLGEARLKSMPLAEAPQPLGALNVRDELGRYTYSALSQLTSPATISWLDDERTERLPDGLPTSAMISLSRKSQLVLMCAENAGGTDSVSFLSPQDLGESRARRDHPNFSAERDEMAEYRLFAIAEEHVYTMTIAYDSRCQLEKRFWDISAPPKPKFVSFGELPEDIRRQVDAAYREWMDSTPGASALTVGDFL